MVKECLFMMVIVSPADTVGINSTSALTI